MENRRSSITRFKTRSRCLPDASSEGEGGGGGGTGPRDVDLAPLRPSFVPALFFSVTDFFNCSVGSLSLNRSALSYSSYEHPLSLFLSRVHSWLLLFLRFRLLPSGNRSFPRSACVPLYRLSFFLMIDPLFFFKCLSLNFLSTFLSVFPTFSPSLERAPSVSP